MTSDTTKHSDSFDTSEVVELLRHIEERLAAAWVEGDRSFIEQILADDWSVTDLTGRVLKKAEVMEEAFGSKDRQSFQCELTKSAFARLKLGQLLREELTLLASIRAKFRKLRFVSQTCLQIETEIGKSSLRKLL